MILTGDLMINDNDEKMNQNNQSIISYSINGAIEDIRRMFVDETQVPRIVNNRQTPAKRAAFAKTHGAVYGTFQVSDNIPQKYQLGIFKPGMYYSAWVRYSSDIAQTAPDLNSTVGIGIKLFNVPGKKVLEHEEDGVTLDFILQNTEVFFAADAVDMANFKSAAMSGELPEFLENNPELAAVLASMEKKVDSLLTEPLWSCVPFKFGNDYCKFKIDAEIVPQPNRSPDYSADNYLAKDLAQRLMNGEVKLNFYVQIRNNPMTQSIISARSLWSEEEAVPFKVATLILYKQNITARQQQEYGESLSFNLWRTLPEMQPVGSIAEARKVTYQSSSQVRRNVNGQSIGEPVQPRAPRLSGMSVFKSTTETPWPVGTLGNATEDFGGISRKTIQPNTYLASLNELTISARDVKDMILINDSGVIGDVAVEHGISYFNQSRTSGSVRILFEKHAMKSVSFDLVSFARNLYNAELTIQAFMSDNFLLESQVTQMNGRITIESSPDKPFDLLTFDFNNNLSSFNLNNFVMTFA